MADAAALEKPAGYPGCALKLLSYNCLGHIDIGGHLKLVVHSEIVNRMLCSAFKDVLGKLNALGQQLHRVSGPDCLPEANRSFRLTALRRIPNR